MYMDRNLSFSYISNVIACAEFVGRIIQEKYNKSIEIS